MPVIDLRRTKLTANETLGELRVLERGVQLFRCFTLELPWRDNKKGISCVPADIYEIVLEYSPAFGMDLWELKGVPGRSECKIHTMNFVRQVNGCIGVGESYADRDKDGITDIVNSKKALEGIHKAMGTVRKSTITIR